MNAPARFAMAAAWALAAAACAPGFVEVPPAAFDLPAPLATSQTTMPIDAIRVAAAIVDRLSGGTGAAAGVTFADGAGTAVGGGEGLAGFDWHDTTLIQYVEGDAAQGERIAGGRLEFEDALGRRAAILFLAAYTTSAEPIEVSEAAVADFFALDPRVETYVVDAALLPAAETLGPPTHAGLLAFAREFDRDAAAGTGFEAVVMVFLMDRVSPSAAFAAGASRLAAGPGAFADDARVLDDGGFRMAVLPAGGGATATIKALFRPGTEVDADAQRARVLETFVLTATAP